MSQSDAYREAYNTKKSTDKSVWECASRLMNDSKVVARIDVLKKGIEKRERIILL